MLPILFQSSDLIIYSYPLFMGIAWGVAYQIYFHYWPQELSKWQGQLIYWGIFLFSWLGAKTLFLLTTPGELPANILTQTNFWLGGGFVFYGGFLGALLYIVLGHFMGLALSLKTLWPMIPALTLGHGIGRIGCFLAGCCYGKETEGWWGVFMHGHYRHPTQLFEAVGLILLGFYTIKSKKSSPVLIFQYLIFYGILRFAIEGLRGDEVRGEWIWLSPSQWISLILLMVGVGGISFKKP